MNNVAVHTSLAFQTQVKFLSPGMNSAIEIHVSVIRRGENHIFEVFPAKTGAYVVAV